MKISRHKNHKPSPRLLALVLLITLLISATAYVYAFNGNIFGWNNRKDEIGAVNKVDYKAPTKDQTQIGNSTKEKFIDEYYPQDNDSKNPENTPNNISIIFSAINQTEDELQLRTVIESTDDGKCELTLSSEGKSTIMRTANTQNLGSYSTCLGFSIPIAEISDGTWQANLSYSSSTGKYNGKVEEIVVVN